MLGALGVNQSVLFTAVFALGALLAGLGGALQVAREPADLGMDLTVITDAFVVVVVGGMGSIVGSYIAAVLVAEVKALCIGLGLVTFRRLFGELFQVHAGRRVSGHGHRADRPAAGLARAGRRSSGARRRRRRKRRSVRPLDRRRSRVPRSPRADRVAAVWRALHPMRWCSASMC